MTVDMEMLHGPQNPGLLSLFADASLWGRPGAHPGLSFRAHCPIVWTVSLQTWGGGWSLTGAFFRKSMHRYISSLQSHAFPLLSLTLLSWSPWRC